MARLAALYERERARLLALDTPDAPDGEYARPVFGGGCVSPALLLIGEAPGAEETRLEKPFVGKAGRQLDELLLQMGVSREEIYITNVVKYRPVVRGEKSVRNRTPSPREIDDGLPLLLEEILLTKPACIATLGNTPLSAVQKLARLPRVSIGKLHGKPLAFVISGLSVTLFPLYHPASGIYNRSLVAVMRQDASKLRENLVKGL